MMARTGILLTVGMVHLLLLLSCLALSAHVPVGAATRDSFFHPSRLTWQDPHFSLASENKTMVIWLNRAKGKFQALAWPESVINLPKGEHFEGFLYFRDSSPATAVLEFLPSGSPSTYAITENQGETDYCIAIDLHDSFLIVIPGYRDKRRRPHCLQCHIWNCRDVMGPCECGYYVITKDPTGNYNQTERKFIGVRWVDVDDPKWTVP